MVEQDNVLDLTLSLETIQLVKQKIAIIRQQEEKGRMVELLKKKLKQFGEEIVPTSPEIQGSSSGSPDLGFRASLYDVDKMSVSKSSVSKSSVSKSVNSDLQPVIRLRGGAFGPSEL